MLTLLKKKEKERELGIVLLTSLECVYTIMVCSIPNAYCGRFACMKLNPLPRNSSMETYNSPKRIYSDLYLINGSLIFFIFSSYLTKTLIHSTLFAQYKFH